MTTAEKSRLSALWRTSFLQGLLLCVLVLLFVSFVGAMFSDDFVTHLKPKFGLSGKQELMTFLGVGMGGVLLALQAVIAYRRSKAMEDNVGEQVKATRNAEDGLRQGRLRDAIEHLGHDSSSVRLGAAYELVHLARDNKELRATVVDILCAHVRRTTRSVEYRDSNQWRPAEEVQSILTLLFVKSYAVFRGIRADLRGSWLNGVNLSRCRLQRAMLRDVHLRGAVLRYGRLQKSILTKGELQGADIVRARLDDAYLYRTNLNGANLGVTNMRGCELMEAQLMGTNLARVQLQGGLLGDVQMQGAHIYQTNMKGANVEELAEKSKPRVLLFAETDSDLRGVTFAGGLTEEALDTVKKDIPKDYVEEVRRKLEPHVGRRASRRRRRGLVTGKYSLEEAKEWTSIGDDRVPAEEDLRIWSGD